ncbi:MAG: DUF4352 domain-containing protein [Chloroflexota bacterium]|nr:DUF4352 domain-containing protein [Chloroflexota bacterium]
MPLKRIARWGVLGLALILIASPAIASAQDATPAAERFNAVGEGFNAVRDPVVGAAVPYLNEQGEEIGTVSVVEVTDPWEDFSEFIEVDEDLRYIGVEISFAATTEPIEANAFDFRLQTADGFFYGDAYISRDISSGDTPDLETISVDPGDEVSGLVFYEVPVDAESARILW